MIGNEFVSLDLLYMLIKIAIYDMWYNIKKVDPKNKILIKNISM